ASFPLEIVCSCVYGHKLFFVGWISHVVLPLSLGDYGLFTSAERATTRVDSSGSTPNRYGAGPCSLSRTTKLVHSAIVWCPRSNRDIGIVCRREAVVGQRLRPLR